MNDEDRQLLHVVVEAVRATMRHLLRLEKVGLRSGNLTSAQLENLSLRIAATLNDGSTPLATMTELFEDLSRARAEGFRLR